MWARVSSYEPTGGDEPEEAIRSFERAMADSLERIQEMAGVRDAFLLVDHASGKALTITLWENEEALLASEDAADQVRRQAAGESIRSVERYEVAFHESFT